MTQMIEALMVFLMALALAITIVSVPAWAEDKLPPAEGKAFWTYIHKTNPYTKWAMWPGHKGLHEGKSPHGNYVRVFANKLALDAVKTGKPMPPGAIIVKENYKDKNTMVSLTPMYKVKGYNPSGGDWYWTKISPDGKLLAEGKLKGCLRCHEAVKSKSWIFHD